LQVYAWACWEGMPKGESMARFQIRELGKKTWPDFARILEKHNGVWGGCWCIAFHFRRPDLPKTAEANRAEKERLVRAGKAHAALVYDGPDVVGWCQFGSPVELAARMTAYGRLKLDPPDWRIPCFFVDRDHRGEGIARAALKGALDFIASKGGGTVDGYPTSNSRVKPTSSSFLWGGTVSMFAGAGFRTVGQLGPSKRLMRKTVRRR
jgi:ribosomal protein S18 acetylase RimI-like enzyme